LARIKYCYFSIDRLGFPVLIEILQREGFSSLNSNAIFS
jgi:hypothetical protein